MSIQLANTVLMIRPAAFGFNEQTARDNRFQYTIADLSFSQIQQKVLNEFDSMVKKLRNNNIEVLVIEDSVHPTKTDAIFPNNWFSTMPDGSLSVFPMYAHNRRLEKRDDILGKLNLQYDVKQFTDWSELEADGFFLEGTGSMVIDHDNKIIYAGLSQRTHFPAVEKFASLHDYKAIVFTTHDKNGDPIYHTNVLMCIGKNFAVVCDECFSDELEWVAVSQLLRTTGHRIILISFEQVNAFAGNMLEVENKNGESFLVMSQTAYDSLAEKQRDILESLTDLLPVSIPTIEIIGGGSARCMLAEIFLKERIQIAKSDRISLRG